VFHFLIFILLRASRRKSHAVAAGIILNQAPGGVTALNTKKPAFSCGKGRLLIFP
jgi:hypothetical protein